MSWLITGGAGYIGAHVVHSMLEAGERVVILDDLSTGQVERVRDTKLVVGSVRDAELLARVIADNAIDGVVHLAAKKRVHQSMGQPMMYYRENVDGLRTLLESIGGTGVRSFVFSSSASVYGMPQSELVSEDTQCLPTNPYGETKLVGEWMVRNVARVTGLRYANLRYFNVAGAIVPELADTGVFNLIPMIFERLEEGKPPRIFGDDYPTPDGTCIRDYVHVADVASAHRCVAQALSDGRLTSLTANVGRGLGLSVREMLDIVRDVTRPNRPPWKPPIVLERRPDDPARVVASALTLKRELGWSSEHDATAMVSSAWNGWMRRRQ